MKKKLLLFFALMATVGLFFTACEPKQPEEPAITLQSIRISPATVSLYEGETYQLRVKYTPEEAKENAPTVLWYSEKQRVASVNDNGLITADRPGTTVITAQCGKLEATCTVEVLKLDLPEPDPEIKFSVTPKNINMPSEGGTFVMYITSNVAWTAELENTEWASLSAVSGEGDAELTLTVNGTEEPEIVSQDITFKTERGKYYVRVTREGLKKLAELKLDKTHADVAVIGGSVTVNVESEAAWNVTCDDPHVTISKSQSSATISVSKYNLTRDEEKEVYGRTTTYDRGEYLKIPVIFSNGDNTVTFYVEQEVPYIRIWANNSSAVFEMKWNKEKHDFELSIRSNIPWEIELTYDGDQSGWASVSRNSGTGDAKVTLTYSANTTGQTRTGHCYVNSTGGYSEFSGTYEIAGSKMIQSGGLW